MIKNYEMCLSFYILGFVNLLVTHNLPMHATDDYGDANSVNYGLCYVNLFIAVLSATSLLHTVII